MNQSTFRELVWQGELQQAERIMIRRYSNSVQISCIHSTAICCEIGERLRGVLTAASTSSPRLTELLAMIECCDATSRRSAEIGRK